MFFQVLVADCMNDEGCMRIYKYPEFPPQENSLTQQQQQQAW